MKIEWDYTGAIPEMLPEKYWESHSKLNDREAVELDTQNLKNKGGFSTTFTTKWEFYEETFLSVVSETLYDNDKLYFTNWNSSDIKILNLNEQYYENIFKAEKIEFIFDFKS